MKHPVKLIKCTFIFILFFLIETSALFAGDSVQPRVTTQWVADNINSIKIIDLRYNDFSKGHIPGTMHMKWGKEFFAQYSDYTVPLDLPETKRVISKMWIAPEDHIVLYDTDSDLRNISRLYWAFKYWNFKKVSIMEGGLEAWQKENRPLIYEPVLVEQNE